MNWEIQLKKCDKIHECSLRTWQIFSQDNGTLMKEKFKKILILIKFTNKTDSNSKFPVVLMLYIS